MKKSWLPRPSASLGDQELVSSPHLVSISRTFQFVKIEGWLYRLDSNGLELTFLTLSCVETYLFVNSKGPLLILVLTSCFGREVFRHTAQELVMGQNS